MTGGVHGADRPGGNNLADTQVFGYRAGRAAAGAASRGGKQSRAVLTQFKIPSLTREEETLLERSADLFYSNLTIVRTKTGCKRCSSLLTFTGTTLTLWCRTGWG